MYQERFRLDGELAVITGGGRGIGLACAEALGEAGARLAVIEPDEAAAQEAARHLTGKGFDAQAFVGDVTRSARMNEIADDLAARGTAATILVNNAGIGQSGIPSEEVGDADWLRMMDVNVNGVFWCSRAFGRHMIRARRDRQPGLHVGDHRQPAAAADALQRLQGGGASPDAVAGG